MTTATGATPGDLFATDGGLYLGLTTKGGTDRRRPLQGKEDDASTPRGARMRTTWQHDGGYFAYEGEGSIGIWAPQGSGKTRKVAIPNALRLRNWSKIIIDVKGTLTASCAPYLASIGHPFHICDPFGVIPNDYPELHDANPKLFSSVGYNHIAALEPDRPYFVNQARALGMGLNPKDEGRDSYWSNAGQQLTKGAVMALRVDQPGTSDTFEALRTVIGLPPEELALFMDKMIRLHGAKYPEIPASLNEFRAYRPEDREIGGIRRNVRVNTDWLGSPLIKADCSRRNSINFASFKQTPQTCFWILPPDELENSGVWLRIMITSALQAMLRSTRDAKVPVLFLIDEIAAIGNIEYLRRNIGLLREYGIKLMMIWQNLQQMKDNYPKSWETFMNAADVKLTFTANDAETRDYFSKLSGERLYEHETISYARNTSSTVGTSDNKGQTWGPQGGSGSKGDGTSFSNTTSLSETVGTQLQREPLIWPREFAGLDSDEAVVFSRRGRVDRVILPQPQMLGGVDRVLAANVPLLIGKAGASVTPAQMIDHDRGSGRPSDPDPHAGL